ncbi:site-2 protease family protein [Desulfosporosinus nitroreducens]|uniref:Site-2 protease family protein n=2 Tax=Desulfosporosinus nitroreducens TaxID=2018668 RepID=A0ABT8QQ50_9FIRM|nr:site-2 protease family protein [Desulfosporosinus nitroreducens]MCO1599979.1 site-2 protease family protein [Desulfosporosinus nitroreducens]MDO0822977.1 site-2 protease family protein [Desulfosporosinus nitroreducens]
MFDLNITTIIANIPALMIGFAFHEFAHAWVADRLGDPTPRSQGRLTLNPFVHLDLFGTLMALIYRFGWAKPVMTNPHYYRGDKRRGQMLVSLAGSIMNLIVAFVVMLLWYLTMLGVQGSQWSDVISLVFYSAVWMNLGLGIFNLLPIPPLDGFGVLRGILPERYDPQLQLIEQYGMIILIVLLFTNILGIVLYPAVNGIFYAYEKIILLILTPFLG